MNWQERKNIQEENIQEIINTEKLNPSEYGMYKTMIIYLLPSKFI